jgi:heat shock protein HslJ
MALEIAMHPTWRATLHVAGRTRRRATLALAACAGLVAGAALAVDHEFPFSSELLLDVAPMKGSKRVPMLEIDDKGLAEIDLWCNSVKGQMVVAGDTITILTGEKTDRSCPPERLQADDDVLAALTEATSWRREGDVFTLIGTRTMRFRVQTN